MLIERAEQILNSTDLSRRTKAVLDSLSTGTGHKLLVMRDNKPAAVMLSIAEYEAQMDELEDLRMESLAAQRLADFDPATAIPHAQLAAEFD